jgi:cellulose synthase/poly-beta-1,6-N-acetylglucosamine synthase-like glycosyltransferase
LILDFTIDAVALAMVVFATPLFLDLCVSIVGNIATARQRTDRTSKANSRSIHLAVVVPAHNEEQMIARTVDSLRASDDATTVFVVAHNCSDATAQRAAEAGAHVLELNNPKVRGKGAALRHGFRAALEAGANAFLVIDADSVVSPNLIAATRAALEQGVGVTQCRYELELPSTRPLHPLARLRVIAFRGINVARARGRAGLGFSAGLFGNGFALTAETLQRVPFTADSITEDIEYHIKLVCAGAKVEWIDDAVVHAPLAAPGSAQAVQEARWEGGRLYVASCMTGKLALAILRGNWRAVEMLAESWSLPLSRGILALLLAAALPIHWLHLWALACALITLTYVLEAVSLGAEPVQDLKALAAAPLHLAWKAAMTPRVLLKSRKNVEWERTKREAPQL